MTGKNYGQGVKTVKLYHLMIRSPNVEGMEFYTASSMDEEVAFQLYKQAQLTYLHFGFYIERTDKVQVN